jgi:hypothetical protein
VARKALLSVEVIEDGEQRLVVATYADGTVVRTPVDPTGRPRHKPRKPIARARPVVRPSRGSN